MAHIACCIISYCQTDHVFNLFKETVQSVFQSNSDYYNLSYSLIIVDNNSQHPGMADYLKQLESMHVQIIRNTENVGYAKAANQGMKLAASFSDWVVMLNSDAICSPGLFHTMVCCAESDEKIAVVGCKVLKPGTNCVIHSGVACTKGKIETPYDIDNPYNGVPVQLTPKKLIEDRLWVNGCCIMFKATILRQEGFFDETYIFYFEEAAYCTKLIQKGYRVVCCDAAIIYHHEKQSALQNEEQTKPQFYKSWDKYWNEHKDYLSTLMTPKLPTVHIVVPCYNSAGYLERTLNSVFNQTYPYFQVWIVNDCSTDTTADVISKFKDNRITVITLEKNVGVSMARNAAIECILAKDYGSNDFVKYLDSDDILRADALEKLIWQYQQNPNLMFFCSDIKCEFEDGSTAIPYGIQELPEFNLEQLLSGNYIYTSSVAHRLLVFKMTQLRFSQGIESIEDWLYWCTAATAVRSIPNSCLWYPEKLVTYLVRQSNNVAAQSNKEKYSLVAEKISQLRQLIKGEQKHV